MRLEGRQCGATVADTRLFPPASVPPLTPEDPALNGTSREEAKTAVASLVEKYRSLSQRGQLGEQNEAEVRTRFITPLLRALGWDVEGLDEVHPEQRTLSGFADYGLKLPSDKRARIFVEAKPFDIGPAGLDGHTFRGGKRLTFAQQAIQYAWQMQASWAILTNFAETRLYSSYVDPKSPDEGLIFKLTWDEYLVRFDELWRLSKEATAEGRLDSLETKRSRQTIHEEAPADLFECREILVADVHRLNSQVSLKEVQEAVQRTLDRLIVIRVAEDRLILPSEALWKLYNSWRETQIDSGALFVSALKDFFQQFDRIYNSEMFAPGHICERVNISNDTVARVLDVLYDYNFDLIDADILGSIYEGYLGYVLREEKGELKLRRDEATRKRTGVYYTPTYVVEYIVDRALGPLLEGADLERVEKMRVLDPACGSGSFLIKAFDRVTDWYTHYNQVQRLDAKGRNTLDAHEDRRHEVHGYRERVLHENLFGVDLDPQAAEIAAINLLLKGLRKGQKLPLILKENVRVGNSLISGHEVELRPYFGDAWKAKTPFSWGEEFPFLNEASGFDAVIGNPPYVDSKAISEDEREYFHDAKRKRLRPFPTAYKKTDLYALFIELGVRLLRPGGRLSLIVPNQFLYAPYASRLREFILDSCVIEEIVDLSNVRVFPHQSVRNVIFVVRKELDPQVRDSSNVRVGVVPEGYPIADGIPPPTRTMEQAVFRSIPECQFRLNLGDSGMRELVQKMEKASLRIDEVCYVNWGIRTGTKEKTQRLVTTDGSDPLAKKMIRGESIADRYLVEWQGEYLTYDPKQLYNPLFPECLDPPKIVVRKISGPRGLFASYDPDGLYPFSTVIIVLPYSSVARVKQARVREGAADRSRDFDLLYILGVINARATRYYFDAMFTDGLGVVPEKVNRLPIPDASPQIQARIATLAQELLTLRRELAEEERIARFRRVISAYPRTGEDDLGRYLGKLQDKDLDVRDRLDSVSRASKIAISAMQEGDWLLLTVRYRERGSHGERYGTIRCRFSPDIDSFLLHAIHDLPNPKLGSGRLMAKIRGIQIPRLDDDWETNLTRIADVGAKLKEHEERVASLSRDIRKREKEIDEMVYSLYAITPEEVRRVEDHFGGPRATDSSG